MSVWGVGMYLWSKLQGQGPQCLLLCFYDFVCPFLTLFLSPSFIYYPPFLHSFLTTTISLLFIPKIHMEEVLSVEGNVVWLEVTNQIHQSHFMLFKYGKGLWIICQCSRTRLHSPQLLLLPGRGGSQRSSFDELSG